MNFKEFDTVRVSGNLSLVIPTHPFMDILKILPGAQKEIRICSDQIRTYTAHVCSPEPDDIFKNPIPMLCNLAFICGTSTCKYHKDNNKITLAACKIKDIASNKEFIWHFSSSTISLLHTLCLDENKSLFELDFLLDHKDPNNPEISVFGVRDYIPPDQFDYSNITCMPKIEDLEIIEKAKSIKYPDGTFGLYCKRCNHDTQWAEPNQPDGSFICRGCVLTMA